MCTHSPSVPPVSERDVLDQGRVRKHCRYRSTRGTEESGRAAVMVLCPGAGHGPWEPAEHRGWTGRPRGDSLMSLKADAEAVSDKNQGQSHK